MDCSVGLQFLQRILGDLETPLVGLQVLLATGLQVAPLPGFRTQQPRGERAQAGLFLPDHGKFVKCVNRAPVGTLADKYQR